jgi:hypothetical protein
MKKRIFFPEALLRDLSEKFVGSLVQVEERRTSLKQRRKRNLEEKVDEGVLLKEKDPRADSSSLTSFPVDLPRRPNSHTSRYHYFDL